jgi:hypothetical protein
MLNDSIRLKSQIGFWLWKNGMKILASIGLGKVLDIKSELQPKTF